MGESLFSCTTLQFWSDNLPCGPATVWNSRRQKIFPSYDNSFLAKYWCWLLHLKTVIDRDKSGKHKSLSRCFVLRSKSWTPQPWDATFCARLRRSDSHSPGELTH